MCESSFRGANCFTLAKDIYTPNDFEQKEKVVELTGSFTLTFYFTRNQISFRGCTVETPQHEFVTV